MSTGYQIVREEEIEHKNEYYELHFLQDGHPHRVFFATNAENLDVTARQIIADRGLEVDKWKVIPHLKH